MELEERVMKLEGDVSELKAGQAETKVYTKLILESINKMETKIDNLDIKKKEPFWDPETKKTAFKWGAIIILASIALLAGKDLFQLTNLLK